MSKKELYYTLACILIFISVWLIIAYPLYFHSDEAWHMVISNQSNLKDVFKYNYQTSVHPPLYYVILHYWQKISVDVIWIRLLSLLFFLGSLPVLYKIGTFLVDSNKEDQKKYKRWRFWLIIISLLSPVTVTISLEVREYSLLWLFLTLQFLYFIKIWYQFTWKRLVTYFIVSLFAIMSHYSAVMTTFILGIFLLYRYYFNFKKYRTLLYIVLCNVSLAVFFLISFYSHSHHYLIDHNLVYKNDYYFVNGVIPALISLLKIFLLSQPILFLFVLTLIYIYPLKKDSSIFILIKLLAIVSLITIILANYLHIYPFPIPPKVRFTTWMLLPIIMLVAIQYYWLEARRKITNILILSILICPIIIVIIKSILFPYFMLSSFQETLKFLEGRGQNDIIVTDIQTAQILSIDNYIDYSFPDNSLPFHVKDLDGTSLYYPSHYLMDVYDIKTNKQEGGISLHDDFIISMLDYMPDNVDSIYIISIGYAVEISFLCPKIEELSTEYLEISNVRAYKVPMSRSRELFNSCKYNHSK